MTKMRRRYIERVSMLITLVFISGIVVGILLLLLIIEIIDRKIRRGNGRKGKNKYRKMEDKHN